MIKFGPAGNPDNFYASGYKASTDMPKWLKQVGLNAYEYQCSKGVKITEKTAKELGKNAAENGIALSVHSPYFISLSSVEKEKRDNSINYILSTLRAADYMGATRIVVHSGSCAKITRDEAMELAKDTIKRAVDAAKTENLCHIRICPETMGKINQLGTVDEVIELCKIDENLMPCIDFGHVNAREMGSLNNASDFESICNKIHNQLGEERGKNFHVHFTRIEYSAGGEKKHIVYDDESFGPCFDPFAEVIANKNLTPVIICESPGTQDIDSLTYKRILESVR